MDDLYENLDNYEDLNIVEQLKNENMELKNKLEEYSKAMDKLQKEFDKVSSDFKKLEMNYSSLLKTAKVEIERKTKIIQDLNVEKDMIVLKALQNKDYRSHRGITKPFQKGPKMDSDFGTKSLNPPTDNLKVKGDCGRNEDNRLSSVDTVTSSNTDVAGRVLKLACNNPESTELWSDRTSDTKENITKKDAEDSSQTKTRAVSIRNRRKSMPAARPQAKFSSDEEGEDTYCRNETYKKFPTREDSSRQNVDKVYNDRYRHKGLEERNKVSETSSVDDRYSGYEPNRDTYHRSRNDKFMMDKYRSRDSRYDNHRHRRHMSPERSRKPPRGEYQRQEYGRQRVLESPPPDKFHYYQQRNCKSRLKHERDDPYNFERTDHAHAKYPAKHKAVNEHFDEPVSKRPRTDSGSKYSEEEKRWIREKGVPLEKTVSDLLEEMPQYTSCQSPDDYLLSDESSPHPIKEIMNIASTPLEDPRTVSKKYILKTLDDSAALSTVTGRNVDLKMVDLSKWGMNKIDIPEALTRRPSQCGDEIMKEVCMDIDNPVSNMSAESGEILSCTEDEPVKSDFKKSSQSIGTERRDLKAEHELLTKTDSEIGSVKSTYRIPKIKNTNQDKPLQRTSISNSNITKSINKIEDSKSDLNKNSRIVKHKADSIGEHIYKDKSKSSLLLKRKCKDPSPTVTKEMIEGDLELSDETCDNTEVHVKIDIEPKATKIKDCKNVKSGDKPSTTTEHSILDHNTLTVGTEIKNIDVKCTYSAKSDESKKSMKLKHADTVHVRDKKDTEVKQIDIVQIDSKKHKSKKKVSKDKEAEKSDKIEKVPDKKDKVKRDKKTKFNELFGDSNSLITPDDLGCNSLISPDDLGINVEKVLEQTSTNYIPICEDAQDAVDVNVSEAAKTITQLAKLKTPEIIRPKEAAESHASTSEIKPNAKPKSISETKKYKTDESHFPDKNIHIATSSSPDLVTHIPLDDPAVLSSIEIQSQTVSEVPKKSSTPQELLEKLPILKHVLHKPDGLMKALATSTPQKVVQQESPDVGTLPVLIESSNSSNSQPGSVASNKSAGCLPVVESYSDASKPPALVESNTSASSRLGFLESCNSASSRPGLVESNNSASGLLSMDSTAGDQSPSANKLQAQEADVPDVRIFVKRRRRVIKKPS